MTTRSPILMGFAALALTACAMALTGAGAPGQAHEVQRVVPVQGSVQPLPFSCSLVARPEGGGTLLEGRLQAREAISVSYALKVRGPGVAVDQEGDLSLPAGETAVLGEASLSSARASLDATLTVTLGDRSYACPLTTE